MSPDWEDRYYSFNSQWSKNEQMGSMRNGSGDEFFALFNKAGCFLKGFAHAYPMTPYRTNPPEIWPGILDKVPDEFASGLNEPAFSMDEVTFCIWKQYSDKKWQIGPIDFPEGDDPDGSEYLMSIMDGNPETYREFAEDYYEESIPLKSIRQIYDFEPLTKKLVNSLNEAVSLKELSDDIAEIGYPVAN